MTKLALLIAAVLLAGCAEAPPEPAASLGDPAATEEPKNADTAPQSMAAPPANETPVRPTVWSPPPPAQYDFGPEPTANNSTPVQATPTPPEAPAPAPASPSPTPQPEPAAPARIGEWINGSHLHARLVGVSKTVSNVTAFHFQFEYPNGAENLTVAIHTNDRTKWAELTAGQTEYTFESRDSSTDGAVARVEVLRRTTFESGATSSSKLPDGPFEWTLVS